MPNLTVRNLTSTPLHITHTSRFAPPQPASAKPDPITKENITDVRNLAFNFTTLLSKSPISRALPTATPPTSQQLAENAKSFDSRDVNVTISPWTTKNTEIPFEADDVLRLEFALPGEREKKFRVDLPAFAKASELNVHPLGDVGDTNLTGIYHPSRNHLALVSSSKLDSWMEKLPDSTSIGKLSIPGTHNSPTSHVALPSVRCQAVGVKQQLENGIRFLDIRVQPGGGKPEDLTLVHGVFPISISGFKRLLPVLREVYEFLEQHRSECVVVSLKREGRGETTDQQLGDLLKKHVFDPERRRWYLESRLPELGKARGKCVLFRRYSHSPLGISAESWAYNTPNCSTASGICVQDFCEVAETENVEKKIVYVREHLERSRDEGNGEKLYVNFLSASNFWKVNCWPDRIAGKINPSVTEHLAVEHKVDGGKAGTGVVVTDFVGEGDDWRVCRLVVGMNAALVKG